MSDSAAGNYTIGPYPVVRHLAQGGMASIYTVECPETGELRAMKLAATVDAKVSGFHDIYTTLSRLDHPNLIPIRSFGETEDGRPYIIFDLFEGLPAQVAARGSGKPGHPSRTAGVITVGIQLAEVLDYLHTHDVIHRDIKSANVLVAMDQSMRLIDFGSAVLPGAEQSESGIFVGTYTYAPPEQIRGEAVDGRADIYAMGILLYRLLSGVRPFHADDPAELARLHLEATAIPLSRRLTDVPMNVCELVTAMLAKNPDDRPAQARDVADALRESTHV
jgi:serine/threonine protein kinase